MASFFLHFINYAAVIGLALGLDWFALDQKDATIVADFAQPRAQVSRDSGLSVEGDALHRSDDGLFYVTAMIRNRPVKFVVDTGATVTVLSPDDAKRIGLLPDPKFDGGLINMVAGSTRMRWAQLSDVSVAGHRIPKVQIALPNGNVRKSLLGQDVLSQLNAMTLHGDRLVLE
jgi:aspartyl protease family protein